MRIVEALTIIGTILITFTFGIVVYASMDEFFKDHAESKILGFSIGFAIALLLGIVIF